MVFCPWHAVRGNNADVHTVDTIIMGATNANVGMNLNALSLLIAGDVRVI